MSDFEQLLQDNLYLKKNLQVTRQQLEKLQQEVSQLRMMNQELTERNGQMNDSYAMLQRKHQMMMAEHNKDIDTLNLQVGELKEYIEKKQHEIEEFQLRMIPNLDQDMLRVKLINEMEGPYQETVEKKEKEISRLKERLADVERKCSLFELQVETKEKEQRREISELKHYYQGQNERLMKDLNAALAKKEAKSYDQQLFKNQRKELEELRCTIHLQQQNQTELRRQVSSLKIDKEKLILQISQLNEKQALQIHLSSENEEIRALKQEKKRLEEIVVSKAEQLEKMEKRHKNLEKEWKRNEDDMRKGINDSRQMWEREREHLKEEVAKLRTEARRVSDKADRNDEDLQAVLQKFKNSERELAVKKEENEKLRATIGELELNIKHYELAKKQKLTLSKHLERGQDKVIKEEVEEKKENDQKRHNQTLIKQKEAGEKLQTTIHALEKANSRLKEKLERANEKIVELLREKAKNPAKHQQSSASRDRAFSNIDLHPTRPRSDKTFLLQYRDVGFTPLVPPTIFTQPN